MDTQATRLPSGSPEGRLSGLVPPALFIPLTTWLRACPHLALRGGWLSAPPHSPCPPALLPPMIPLWQTEPSFCLGNSNHLLVVERLREADV